MAKIDKKDKKILEILEKNSRISLTALSKKVNASPQAIHYRINKLLSEKVILNFPTIIDPAYFSLIEIKVHFRILYVSPKVLEEIISHFKKHRYVTEIIECGGTWDLIMTYMVKNLSQFNKLIHEDIEKFQKHLQPDIKLFSVVHHYPQYNFLIGGDRIPITFNKKTKKLISLLALNSKTTIIELVKKLKLDPKTIIKRIKKLKKENVIRAFTINIDKSLLNKTLHKVLIRYSKISTRKENQLLQFIKKQNNIRSFSKLIGQFDVEFEIEIEKPIELRKLMFEIREKFSDIIQDINEIPLYHLHKRIYLPEFILKD